MESLNLSFENRFNLTPKAPFNFDGTFHKPSHFPNNLKLSLWASNIYWQTLRIGDKLYGLRIKNEGNSLNPLLKIAVFSSGRLENEEIYSIKQEIIYRFELDVDWSEFNNMAEKDDRFYPIFKKWTGSRNSCEFSLYELLIISIVLQNATVHRSVQMLDALLGKYGTKVLFDGRELYAIWLPEELEDIFEQDLRDLKVGYRAKFIKRISSDFVLNKVDERKLRILNKEDAKNELIKLYGVGSESSRILLFEALHHYDTFDHIAPWQQKIYSRLFYNKEDVLVSKIQNDINKKYGKYAMLAVHYIWEDIFWRRKNEHIEWLEKEIRL